MNPLHHPRAPMIFLAHVCAIVIVMIFGIVIGLSAPCFPRIEGSVWPVVSGSLVGSSVTRDDARACYTMVLLKLRAAEPVVYQFAVEVRQNEHWLAPANVNAHVMDEATGLPNDDYQNHPVGTSWHRRWCFDLPASVAPYQVIRVSGYAVHRAHPLWDTHSATPAFVIGPAD